MRLAARSTVIAGAFATLAIASPLAAARLNLEPTTTGQAQTTTTTTTVVKPNPDQQVTQASQARPPILRSATASQLPEVHRAETASSDAFAYQPSQSARYSTAGLNGTQASQAGPPILRSATASQLPEVHRAETASSHAFAYQPSQSARYSTAGLNGYVKSPTSGGPAVVHSNPFDWGDAAIGAAGGLVISLLIVGGGVLVVRRREPKPARAKALA